MHSNLFSSNVLQTPSSFSYWSICCLSTKVHHVSPRVPCKTNNQFASSNNKIKYIKTNPAHVCMNGGGITVQISYVCVIIVRRAPAANKVQSSSWSWTPSYMANSIARKHIWESWWWYLAFSFNEWSLTQCLNMSTEVQLVYARKHGERQRPVTRFSLN